MDTKKEIVVKGLDKFKGEPSDDIVEMIASEIEAIVVQKYKEQTEAPIFAEWSSAKTILDNVEREKISMRKLISKLAATEAMKMRHLGERKLWMAMAVIKHFPVYEDIFQTEHGENISINKLHRIVHPVLPKPEPTLEDVARLLYNKYGPDRTQKLIKELQKLVK